MSVLRNKFNKSLSLIIALMLIVASIPMIGRLAAKAEEEPVEIYNPYKQISESVSHSSGSGTLNSGNMDFAIKGALWGSSWYDYDRANVDGGKYKISSSSRGDTDGYAYLWANSDFSDAIGTGLNDPQCFVNMIFTAPVSAEYWIRPKAIAAAGNKSVYVHKLGQDSVSDKTFTITVNGTEEFSITRNSSNPTGDLPDDIRMVLQEGQTISFMFSSDEDGVKGCMFANFDICLMRYSDDDVNGVHFLQRDYIVPMGGALNIAAVVRPAAALNQDVSYDVEDTGILEIDNDGSITPKKSGYTEITVTTDDGGFTDTTMVCVYDPSLTSKMYDIAAMYTESQSITAGASGAYPNTTGTTPAQPWTGLYKLSEAASYTKYPYISRPWGASDQFSSFDEYISNISIYQYADAGKVITVAQREEGGTAARFNALEFTAPEYGIYSLTYSENNPDAYKGYLSLHSGWADEHLSSGGTVKVNFYLNGSKLRTVELTKNKQKEIFIPLNFLEMNAGDKLIVEMESTAQSLLYAAPKMIKVLSEKPVKPVTKVTMSESSKTLVKNQEYTLTANVLPVNASDKSLAFASSNPSVAAVNAVTGLVTAKNPGTAVITAQSVSNPGMKDTCTVAVILEMLDPISELLPAIQSAASKTNESEPYNYTGNFFASSTRPDGVYEDFNYAVKFSWGLPDVVLTNMFNYNMSAEMDQQYQIFSDNGKPWASFASFTNGSWVGLGFKAPMNANYRIMPDSEHRNIILSTNNDTPNNSPTYVRITKNGQQIWPDPLTYPNGHELKKSGTVSIPMPEIGGISMYKGDMLRFEAYGQSDFYRNASVRFNYKVAVEDEVAVTNPVTAINVNPGACEMSIDEIRMLSCTVAPDSADNKNVRFVSSNPSVLMVDAAGKMTALKAGTSTVKAISEENEDKFGECNVTVTAFKVIRQTPDEIVKSFKEQLTSGNKIVNSMPIEYNTNWEAQYSADGGNTYSRMQGLTTSYWGGNPPDGISNLRFDRTWADCLGFEYYSGRSHYQPYISTYDTTVALVYKATRAGTYSLSPDSRSKNITTTYAPAGLMDEEFEFAIYVNENKIFSTMLSGNRNSVPFPEIDDIFLDVYDVIRFAFIGNSKLDRQNVNVAPVVSLVRPDPELRNPVAENQSVIIEPNKVYTGKMNAIHPNAIPITYTVLDTNEIGVFSVDANGAITFTPKSNYKGVGVYRVRLSDTNGKSVTVTVTITIADKYNSVETLTALLEAGDPAMGSEGAKVLDYGSSPWKFQYTYDGLTYATGSPKYHDAGMFWLEVTPSWWGYYIYSDGCPRAIITPIEGIPSITVSAGNAPWGLNPVGGVSFYAPKDATYILSASPLFDKIRLNVDSSNPEFTQPMKVWITKNGKKIWPEEQNYIEFSKSNLSLDFPELTVAMMKDDNVRICVSGHVDNGRFNEVVVYPLVYDIGAYDKSLDPNPEPEELSFKDDDGEQIIYYDDFRTDSFKKLLFSNGFDTPVFDEFFTVDKIKIPSGSDLQKFGFTVSFDACKDASKYQVMVYVKKNGAYEKFFESTVEDLSLSVQSLKAGEYYVQVTALDKFGQYLEVYTAKSFTVSGEGDITFRAADPQNNITGGSDYTNGGGNKEDAENTDSETDEDSDGDETSDSSNKSSKATNNKKKKPNIDKKNNAVWIIVISAVAVVLAAAGTTAFIIIKKRKAVGVSNEKSSNN